MCSYFLAVAWSPRSFLFMTTGRAIVSWMLSHYGLPDFEMLEDRRPQYLLALETADAALKTEDLLHADYWPHQTEALQPLIDVIGEVLKESI